MMQQKVQPIHKANPQGDYTIKGSRRGRNVGYGSSNRFAKMAEFFNNSRWPFRPEPLPSISVDTLEEPSVMTRLQQAANAKNARAFIHSLKEVNYRDWSCDDFRDAIRLAQKAGAFLTARQISTEAIALHPHSEELQKYARALAPARIVSRDVPPSSEHIANRNWLKKHAASYNGQWVALRNGELLGAAASLEELVKQIGNTKGILLTRAL